MKASIDAVSRRGLLAAGAVAGSAVWTATAKAKGMAYPRRKKRRPFKVSAKLGKVDVSRGQATFAADTSGTLGKGAIAFKTKADPYWEPNWVDTVTPIDFRAYFAGGSLQGRVVTRHFPQPDGSDRFSGTGTITEGGGNFAGAKGTFKVSGVIPAGQRAIDGATLASFTLEGSFVR